MFKLHVNQYIYINILSKKLSKEFCMMSTTYLIFSLGFLYLFFLYAYNVPQIVVIVYLISSDIISFYLAKQVNNFAFDCPNEKIFS